MDMFSQSHFWRMCYPKYHPSARELPSFLVWKASLQKSPEEMQNEADDHVLLQKAQKYFHVKNSLHCHREARGRLDLHVPRKQFNE